MMGKNFLCLYMMFIEIEEYGFGGMFNLINMLNFCVVEFYKCFFYIWNKVVCGYLCIFFIISNLGVLIFKEVDFIWREVGGWKGKYIYIFFYVSRVGLDFIF